MPVRLLLASTLLLASACAQAAPPVQETPLTFAANFALVFQCPDGTAFVGRERGDSIEVTYGTESFTLAPAMAASGARYSDGTREFWSRGAEARLEAPGYSLQGCVAAAADDPWQVSRLLGYDFRAIGQEPGWMVEVESGRRMHVLADYGEFLRSLVNLTDLRPLKVAVDAGKDIPDAHDSTKRHRPRMLTSDIALRVDPVYGPIARRFLENPQAFADAFARAWFKLTHRDMGPRSRYLGPEVPRETLIWQDPVPAPDHALLAAAFGGPRSVLRLPPGTNLVHVALAGAALGNALVLCPTAAMAGTIGAGGVGDLALTYGYQAFNTPLMMLTVVVLIVFVQGIQTLGNTLARRVHDPLSA